MVRLAVALVALWFAAACGDSSDSSAARKPTGTPTDPVEVCERVADVCRLDGAKLGVCVEAAPNAASCPPDGSGKAPAKCFVCQSQH